MSNNVFNRLRNLVKEDNAEKPSGLSRYIGGNSRKNHPYVTGYWQFFVYPPSTIFEGMEETATEWWHSTAESFTPPTRNLNKGDVPGQGGLGSSWITGQTLNRTFSVAFREYRNLPIYNLYCLWTSIIDPNIGVSPVSGNKWVASTYKGSAFAILTRPTASIDEDLSKEDIEDVYFFHGVWPENQPDDALASDISGPNLAQLSMNFSFDGWPLKKNESQVLDKAAELLVAKKYIDTTYDHFIKDLTSTTT